MAAALPKADSREDSQWHITPSEKRMGNKCQVHITYSYLPVHMFTFPLKMMFFFPQFLNVDQRVTNKNSQAGPVLLTNLGDSKVTRAEESAF